MATNNSVNVSLKDQTGTGEFVGSTSPTIVTPEIAQINDTNGNPIVELLPSATAVNYLRLTNQATGASPSITPIGSDTNIGLTIATKGISPIGFQTEGTSLQYSFYTGTGFQHVTNWSYASTLANRTITVPDASGTVTLLGNASTGTGSIVLQTSPTITTPQIAQINDASGNSVLGLGSIASAVNTIVITNNSAGLAPLITTAGSDTDVDMQFNTQGAGKFTFYCNGLSNQFNVGTGAALGHLTQFTFPNTNAIQTVSFPDATGTVQLQSQPLITAPPASQSSSLAIGTAYQNVLGYDVVLTVYLAVASATTASILLGVGPTNTPTQQTIVSGLSLLALGIIPVTIYLPNNYYALLSTSGTISISISGQQVMPV